MLVIIFEPLQGNSIKLPPLFQPVSYQMLTNQCHNLQKIAHEHFKQYLSPFIRKEHLELTNLKEVLIPDYPFFVYFNSTQHTTNILCSLKSFNAQNYLKRSHLLKNSVVLIHEGDKLKQQIIRNNDIKWLDKKLQKNQTVLICGKQIKLLQEEDTNYLKWSELIMKKWEQWQNQNQTIYIRRKNKKKIEQQK